MNRLSTSAAAAGTLGVMLLAACAKTEPPSAPAAPTASTRAPAPPYPTRAYFGDTHLHTALSLDAGAAGARLLPADAYRFAKGEEVTGASGQKAKLAAPAGFPGRHRSLRPDGPDHRSARRQAGTSANPEAKHWYDLMNSGKGAQAHDGDRDLLRAGQVSQRDACTTLARRVTATPGWRSSRQPKKPTSQASSPPSSATNGPRWSLATTCIATSCSATTATRPARSNRSPTTRLAVPTRGICGSGWRPTKTRPAARCWRLRTTATSATA